MIDDPIALAIRSPEGFYEAAVGGGWEFRQCRIEYRPNCGCVLGAALHLKGTTWKKFRNSSSIFSSIHEFLGLARDEARTLVNGFDEVRRLSGKIDGRDLHDVGRRIGIAAGLIREESTDA